MTNTSARNSLAIVGTGAGWEMIDAIRSLKSYSGAELSWHTGQVVFIDVVESVRLMSGDAGHFIRRWINLRGEIEGIVRTISAGRLVRSSGDGIILEFNDVVACIKFSFAAIKAALAPDLNMEGAAPLAIRVGIAEGEFLSDTKDIYGQSVNLAARLAGLARPNGIVVSERLKDRLVDGFDADIEDMGYCFLKHIERPVRAYAISEKGRRPAPASVAFPMAGTRLAPTIAVIPFTHRQHDMPQDVIGDIIAEDIIRGLSGSYYLTAVSRLSSAVFRRRTDDLPAVGQKLGADFIISGRHDVLAGHIHAELELSEQRTGTILLSDRLSFPVSSLSDPGFDGFEPFLTKTTQAIMQAECRRLRRECLPNIETHSLLLGAIAMMHGTSQDDFLHAAKVLEELTERHPREAQLRAFLAWWYSLKASKGASTNPYEDGLRAVDQAHRAIDLDPDNSLAFSVAGLVNTNFFKKFDISEKYLGQAVGMNPNNSIAYLQKSALYYVTDRGKVAYDLSVRARQISPCDPNAYYFDVISASAAFSAGMYEQALVHANDAIRANRLYPSGMRVRTAALSWLGRIPEARTSAESLMQLEPNMTVRGWLEHSPAEGSDTGSRFAEGLRLAGVPEG